MVKTKTEYVFEYDDDKRQDIQEQFDELTKSYRVKIVKSLQRFVNEDFKIRYDEEITCIAFYVKVVHSGPKFIVDYRHNGKKKQSHMEYIKIKTENNTKEEVDCSNWIGIKKSSVRTYQENLAFYRDELANKENENKELKKQLEEQDDDGQEQLQIQELQNENNELKMQLQDIQNQDGAITDIENENENLKEEIKKLKSNKIKQSALNDLATLMEYIDTLELDETDEYFTKINKIKKKMENNKYITKSK